MPAWAFVILMCSPRENRISTIQGIRPGTNASLSDYLNWFGEQGWEFAGMASDNVGFTTIILKRRKAGEEA